MVWESNVLILKYALIDLKAGKSPCTQMRKTNPFHVAFPVTDLAQARQFYGTVLGCEEGRSSAQWIDFNLGNALEFKAFADPTQLFAK
jgi:extradiol dioxygenase family protein